MTRSRKQTFVARVRLPVSVEEAFAWHARPGAFERLAPPWQPIHVVRREGTIRDGDRVVFETGGFEWSAVHRGFVDGVQFQDEQERGPFASWLHTHRFSPAGPDASWLDDEVVYQLPLGWLGRATAGRAVQRRLERLFRHRHRVLRADLSRHRRWADRGPLRIAVSGASGFIGSALVPFLTTGGHEVLRLVRREAGPGEIAWDPERGTIDAAHLEGVDAVVHLAGENIGEGRWTPARKERILRSRVDGTRLLAQTLASLRRPPRVWVSVSAIGIYGTSPSSRVDETSPAGDDFLARVCVAWEDAAVPAEERGIRVVHPRFGVVLSPTGGALGKMLPPFSLGLGGRVGSGRQPMSWVALDDAIGAIHACLYDERLRGAVNVVAPQSVSNAAFAATLGRVLRRPALVPLPRAAVRLLFGEMGESLLLGGADVSPRRLLDGGFRFESPDLELALRRLLGSPDLESEHDRPMRSGSHVR